MFSTCCIETEVPEIQFQSRLRGDYLDRFPHFTAKERNEARLNALLKRPLLQIQSRARGNTSLVYQSGVSLTPNIMSFEIFLKCNKCFIEFVTILFVFCWFFFFLAEVGHMRSLLPGQGLNSHPLH